MSSGRSVPRSTGRRPAACRGPTQQPELHCCAAGATEASPTPPAASRRRSTVAPTREFSKHPVSRVVQRCPEMSYQSLQCHAHSRQLPCKIVKLNLRCWNSQAPLMAHRIQFCLIRFSYSLHVCQFDHTVILFQSFGQHELSLQLQWVPYTYSTVCISYCYKYAGSVRYSTCL